MTILLHRALAIGDNVVAIKAIYALKCLYPHAQIIVATNNIGARLFAKLPFIDTLINIDADSSVMSAIKRIDYLIITHRTAQNIAFAKSTDARKIVLRAHLHSLHSPRFINDFNFLTQSHPESANLLRLVRLVDKRVFDSGIGRVDFSKAKLRWTRENSDFIDEFFANRGGQSEKNNSKNFARFSDKNRKIIGINFFGSGGVAHLRVEAWREIITELSSEFSAYNFIVFCPPNREVERFNVPNVAIFKNNHDLLNLVAMSARLNALISVDTGNIHIADNLQIPTLGIYTRKMARRWRGGTYGGKFSQFVVADNDRFVVNDNNGDKDALLAFLNAEIPNML